MQARRYASGARRVFSVAGLRKNGFLLPFLGKRLAKIGCPREETVVKPLWDQSPAEVGMVPRKTPLEFVWVLARRLGRGLAGVGKGNPPQRLIIEIVSAPTRLMGLEWCVETLCKCTKKMLSETICGAQP